MVKAVLNRKKTNILVISQIISTVFQRIFINPFQRNSVIKKALRDCNYKFPFYKSICWSSDTKDVSQPGLPFAGSIVSHTENISFSYTESQHRVRLDLYHMISSKLDSHIINPAKLQKHPGHHPFLCIIFIAIGAAGFPPSSYTFLWQCLTNCPISQSSW